MSLANCTENILEMRLKLSENEFSTLKTIAKRKHLSVEKIVTKEIRKFIKFHEIKVSINKKRTL